MSLMSGRGSTLAVVPPCWASAIRSKAAMPGESSPARPSVGLGAFSSTRATTPRGCAQRGSSVFSSTPVAALACCLRKRGTAEVCQRGKRRSGN